MGGIIVALLEIMILKQLSDPFSVGIVFVIKMYIEITYDDRVGAAYVDGFQEDFEIVNEWRWCGFVLLGRRRVIKANEVGGHSSVV